MKRGVKNILLSLLGFSASPLLTACYGIGPDYYQPIEGIEGYVVNEELQPIRGIEVSDGVNIQLTSENGEFKFNNSYFDNGITLTATDIDGSANGGDFQTQSVWVDSSTNKTTCIIMTPKE